MRITTTYDKTIGKAAAINHRPCLTAQIRKALLILCLMMVGGSSAWAVSTTYYAKVTAHVASTPTGAGKVYASATDNDSGEYKETSEVESSSTNQQIPFYLFAQPNERYAFKGWYAQDSEGDALSVSARYEVTVTGTTDQNSPGTKDYWARFERLADPAGITVFPSEIVVARGKTYVLRPQLIPVGCYKKIEYTVTEGSDKISVSSEGVVTGNSVGTAKVKVRAMTFGDTDPTNANLITTVTVTVKEQCATPVIKIESDGTVSISTATPSARIYYTINGDAPTSSSTLYGGPISGNHYDHIQAIAVTADDNYIDSEVAEFTYILQSGVSGGTVTLYDYEDHTWTYYAGVPAEVDGGYYNGDASGYKGRIYSPNPRNVKITYKGNGGAVSIDESETEFVYYKTLEESATAGEYPYQVISNPFSKRPTGKGFGGWQITKGADYIKNKAANATLALDEEIVFEKLPYPSVNCTSAEIELTATWVNANITNITRSANQTINANGTYETNLVVVQTNYTNTLTINGACTIMMVAPDGSADYRANTLQGSVTPSANGVTVKLEHAQWNPNGAIAFNSRNVTIGRGVTCTSSRDVRASNGGANVNQTLKIESGTFGSFTHYSATVTSASFTKQHVYLGNDYDRAKGDNSRLTFTGRFEVNRCDGGSNYAQEACRVYSKSGSFMTGTDIGTASRDNSYYLSYYGNTNPQRRRYLEIEGGEWYANISGGQDNTEKAVSSDAFTFRMRGGIVRGSIYASAQQYNSQGNRVLVFTGGKIGGWIAGAANGTTPANGVLYGSSYVYFGGNAEVATKHQNRANAATTKINESIGGYVFASGCGDGPTSQSGSVTVNTNVVLGDNAVVEHGVYGGGAYGKSTGTANIYVTGGHVESAYDSAYNVYGGVYGGARQNSGNNVKIYMTGGQIDGVEQNKVAGGGLYGGSNASGTINGSVIMQINGGQVGTKSQTANIHGGGYGQSTVVSQNVDITLGKTRAARDADGVTVWGDVYGGSALGSVNGTTAADTYHTNVTMNAGYIHGSLYGGALGAAGTAANVYGPVQVKVYGGSVSNTDGSGANGSGAVYGANNINGAPQRSVTVDIYGTNSAPADGEYALFSVYGGGNAADYTYGNGYPKVTVHGCDNSIEYVYGGGNAAAVAATDVTIYGGDKIGNVFGGGNGQVKAANVNGGTNVKIYGGTIGDVYGGSNTNGTIGGTISVNVDARAEDGQTACPIDIDNVYGGGNKAASNVGRISIGCAEHIGAVYGGANQANITGNIDLRINSGHIDNVFGGNNTSGNISGTISVTVEDNGSACGMEVGNVYGGGNKAAYGTGTNYPVVNINNGHLTGSVFGGGLGATAVVTGNPQVTIGQPSSGTVHIDGNVFGGGDAANVAGRPVVHVQNCSTQIGTKDGEGNWNATGGTVYGGGNAAHVTGAGNGTSVTIDGGDIRRVFGGGNGEVSPANVEGNAVTAIHAGSIHQAFAGSNKQGSIGGSATISVDHTGICDEKIDEVYGGGNEAAGNAGAVNIDCGAIVGDVYGGANAADINNDITLNIAGGTIDRVFGGNNTSGNISGAITVNVEKSPTCDLDLGEVFGAGNLARYTGNPAVNIKNGTVKKNVYGGGKGDPADHTKGQVTGNPVVTIGDTSKPASVAVVGGDVYGGGDAGNVVGTPQVRIPAKENTSLNNIYGGGNAADVAGTDVQIDGGHITGMVFGGGHGNKDAVDSEGNPAPTEANVSGDVSVLVTGGAISKVFGGSNSKGTISGDVTVTVNKADDSMPMKIDEVYGGGNVAAGNAGTINIICTGAAAAGEYVGDVYGGANAADVTSDITLNITGGKINRVFGGNNASGNISGAIVVNIDDDDAGCDLDLNTVYGAGNKADYSGSPVVNIKRGTVKQDVFGGGLQATVGGNTQVNVTGGAVLRDTYGGGALANVNGNTEVNLTGGSVGNVYGGGLGSVNGKNGATADVEALVKGNTLVTLNGSKVTGSIFGCNNLNGTPRGHAKVHVLHTTPRDGQAVSDYDVAAVYGGGDQAAYIPSDETIAANQGYAEVLIENCDNSINYVYGGGNAAPVPATLVTIYGADAINNAFAGGNGAGDGNPGADIGYLGYYSKGSATGYGTGVSAVHVYGGTVNNVYGGSNTLGYIRDHSDVQVQNAPDDYAGSICTLNVGNVFGGGNKADMNGNVELLISCSEGADVIFAGASNADVNGNITLTITSGTYGKVFGGNNDGGSINGSITVNIDETSTCWPVMIGELYGCGNNAAYTTPASTPEPVVNVIACTKIGKVFGGGYGPTATVTGNPTVNVNMIKGSFAGQSPTPHYIINSAGQRVSNSSPYAIPDDYGQIGNIYGGGNAADVVGDTYVNIGTLDENHHVSGSDQTTLQEVGANIVGSVFGGGNVAKVSGDTHVNIGNE